VEKAYFDSIDDVMAEKYKLQMDVPEVSSPFLICEINFLKFEIRECLGMMRTNIIPS
jgi:hypothetical protein